MAESDAETGGTLSLTPLHPEHLLLGARMVPFAGYEMPVQYADGIIAEHNWTRTHAGLFDVSHMGQAILQGRNHAATAHALEALVPADVLNLQPGRMRYSQLLSPEGGIIDDLMIYRPVSPDLDGRLYLVVNAARKAVDFTHLFDHLPSSIRLDVVEDRALLALQGPEAAAVMERHCPAALGLDFMSMDVLLFDDYPMIITRSGYTGEDGFEISLPAQEAPVYWARLLEEPEVRPIGLGARDSLRLEAGLCLYGHDIDLSTSPVEAALTWSIQKRRREEGGFPGAARLQRELVDGPARLRVGLAIEGRAPAREGAEIALDGGVVGRVTSGGFSPTLGSPIAMGYVPPALSAPGTKLSVLVRDKALPATVVPLPFVPTRYHRKPR